VAPAVLELGKTTSIGLRSKEFPPNRSLAPVSRSPAHRFAFVAAEIDVAPGLPAEIAFLGPRR
jgi:hypothetical protein